MKGKKVMTGNDGLIDARVLEVSVFPRIFMFGILVVDYPDSRSLNYSDKIYALRT